jgi:hypothetical protein
MRRPHLRTILSLLFSVFLFSNGAFSQNENDRLKIELPFALVRDIQYDIDIILPDKAISLKPPHVYIDGIPVKCRMKDGKVYFTHKFTHKTKILVISHNAVLKQQVNPIPLWLSILPPLLAIFMAFVTKEVYTSLFLGLLSGTLVIFKYQGLGWFTAFFKGLFAIVDFYVLESLYNYDHISVIVFSMLIGGIVAIITANGGMKGLVGKLAPYAKNKKSGQMITWLLGILIFFDDYANTLIVGNTMRPIPIN